MSGIEKNLPENRQKRLDEQARQARAVQARWTAALWHVKQGETEYGLAQQAKEPAISNAFRMLVYALESQVAWASRMSDAADRIADENVGTAS